MVFVLLIGAACKHVFLFVFISVFSVAKEDDKFYGCMCEAYVQPLQVSLNSVYNFYGGSMVNNNLDVSAAHCYKFYVTP